MSKIKGIYELHLDLGTKNPSLQAARFTLIMHWFRDRNYTPHQHFDFYNLDCDRGKITIAVDDPKLAMEVKLIFGGDSARHHDLFLNS